MNGHSEMGSPRGERTAGKPTPGQGINAYKKLTKEFLYEPSRVLLTTQQAQAGRRKLIS